MKKVDSNSKLVEQIIHDGHEIAKRIRNCKSVSEVEELWKEAEKYTNLIDEKFGIESDFDSEKEAELSTCLCLALKSRKTSLYEENIDNPATKRLADGDLEDFERLLDSKAWTACSYGIKLK